MSLPSAHDIHSLPGDPATVRDAAGKYTRTATAISEAAAHLRLLASETRGGSSDAVDALVEAAGDAADRIGKLHTRYATAGSALTTYASELEDAQRMATSAVDMRDSARSEQHTADYWIQHYEHEQHTATTPAALEEAQRQLHRYRSRMESLEGDVTDARRVYADAVEKVDRAAQTAADLISKAVDRDGMNDSWWDDFSGWVADNAEIIRVINKVLGVISAVLGVLSLFFPVLAPFALALAGLTALTSLLLAATGNGSWVDFGLDMLGVLTLGVGKIAGTMLKSTMTALKGVRVANVAEAAAAAGKSPARMIAGSFNRLTVAKMSPLRIIKASAENALKTVPRWLNKGISLSEDARWVKEIQKLKGIDNAQVLRILAGAKAGATGLANEVLVKQAQTLVKVQTTTYLAATILKAPKLADTILTGAEHLPLPDVIQDGARFVTDLADQGRSATTWRVGSH